MQVFHCREQQTLHRVHFFQPTVLLILRGTKQLSGGTHQQCEEGNMLAVAAGHEFPFANVPRDFYMALAIAFEAEDFPVRAAQSSTPKLTMHAISEAVLTLTHQLMALAPADLPPQILASRRKEIASLLTQQELDAALRCPSQPTWRQRVVSLLQNDIARDWRLEEVCRALATSESNLRRHLAREGCGFRDLLEDLRLTYGLGMIQTTALPINQVALACGYQSASRFSERFKQRFETTPSELRSAL
ncbi:MAG: helix-turn-helix transcriptional regulator [Oleiphilaceae bacterium]|nr:helix-turn-helix transcriptional regulator [Oleiphilaceae bacterium]